MFLSDFYQECCDKYGFEDGASQPGGAYVARDEMVSIINRRLKKKGIKTHRLTSYDRPGMHNGVMVLWVDPDTGETIEEPEGFGDILAELDEEFAVCLNVTIEKLND